MVQGNTEQWVQRLLKNRVWAAAEARQSVIVRFIVGLRLFFVFLRVCDTPSLKAHNICIALHGHMGGRVEGAGIFENVHS